MRRLFLPLFFALAIAVTATILATSGMLPERVASHFASGGAANGWMSREAYVLIVLAMATLLPLFIVAMMARLPRRNVDCGEVRALPALVPAPRRFDILAHGGAVEGEEEILVVVQSSPQLAAAECRRIGQRCGQTLDPARH